MHFCSANTEPPGSNFRSLDLYLNKLDKRPLEDEARSGRPLDATDEEMR